MNSIQLLRDLVRLPSVNPMGRSWASDNVLYEHRLTAYMERSFTQVGVTSERQTVAPKRDNIIALFDSPGASRTSYSRCGRL
jgi:acetylornithine deacetylase